MYSMYSSRPPAYSHYSYMSSSPDRGGYSSPTYASYTTGKGRKGSSYSHGTAYDSASSSSRQPAQFQYYTPPQFTYASPSLKMAPRKGEYATSAKRSHSDAKRDEATYRSRTSRPSRQDAQVRTPRGREVREVTSSESEDAYRYPRRSAPAVFEVRLPRSSARTRTDYDTDRRSSRGAQTRSKDAAAASTKPLTRGRSNTYPARPSRNGSMRVHSRGRAAATTTDTPRPATAADAIRAGIPAGYSLKNWDPDEEPIYVLGSVFDANSLGKWIYDWTVFSHGPASPLAEVAGDLWLNLIQLAGKVKRAQAVTHRIRDPDDGELVEDFILAGERLWDTLKDIITKCEDYMWRAAKRESGNRVVREMGANSGREFVDSMFGRDRELEDTEKLMQGVRLWSMRFDANCEDILRCTTA